MLIPAAELRGIQNKETGMEVMIVAEKARD